MIGREIWRGILTAGLFFAPFLVFIVSKDMFFPFITGKNFTFRIITEILFAGWLILLFFDRSLWPKRSAVVWSFLATTTALILATIFGENPMRSFWSNYERMEGLLGFLHLGAYFLMLVSLFQEKHFERYFQVSFGVSILISLYGLLQAAFPEKFTIHQGGVRVDASFGNATYLAVYELFHIFIALILLAKNGFSGRLRQILYGSGIILSLAVLYLTATRGAILGLLGGLFVSGLSVLFFEWRNLRVRKIGLATVGVLILLVGLFLVAKDTNFVRQSEVLARFATISLTETTTESRFLIWGMSLDGFKEKPILGWGPENYINLFAEHYRPELYRQEPWFDRAHNVVFDWLVSAGLLGLLSYLSLFASAVYLILKNRSVFKFGEYAILLGLLSAYFFHNLFVFDNLISYLFFILILAYVHIASREAFGTDRSTDKLPEKTKKVGQLAPATSLINHAPLRLIASLMVILVFSAGMYFLTLRPIFGASYITESIRPHKSADARTPGFDLNKNKIAFEKAIKSSPLGRTEAREQLIQLTARILEVKEVSQADKEYFSNLVIAEFEKQILESPQDVRHHFFYGAFLNRLGRYKEAEIHLKKAAEISPKKQFILIELARNYVSLGKIDLAREVAEYTVNLDPRYIEPVSFFVGVAVKQKDFSAIIEKIELSVGREPGNVRLLPALAAAYYEIGKRDVAIEKLQEAIEKNPEFRAEGEKYLAELKAGRPI